MHILKNCFSISLVHEQKRADRLYYLINMKYLCKFFDCAVQSLQASVEDKDWCNTK